MSKVPSVLSVGAMDGYSIKIYRDFKDVLSRSGEIRNLGNRADWKNAYFSIPWLHAWLKRQPRMRFVLCSYLLKMLKGT